MKEGDAFQQDALGSVGGNPGYPAAARTVVYFASSAYFWLGPKRTRITKIEEFFARYEEGANSFGANSFDPDLVCSQCTTEFMAGGPGGVACGRNDRALRKAFIQRHALFQQIGFKRAKILHVDATPLDDKYTMAKVHWHMAFDEIVRKALDTGLKLINRPKIFPNKVVFLQNG